MPYGIAIDDQTLGSAVGKNNPLPIYTPGGYGIQVTDGTRTADIATDGTANGTLTDGFLAMTRDTGGTFRVMPAYGGGFSLPPFDYTAMDINGNIETYTFKEGGASGVLVATVEITYTDNTRQDIVTAIKT